MPLAPSCISYKPLASRILVLHTSTVLQLASQLPSLTVTRGANGKIDSADKLNDSKPALDAFKLHANPR